MNAKIAAVYARVSTPHQVPGASLDVQIETCLTEASSRGLEVPERHIYRDEGISGSTEARPALQRMLRDADQRQFSELLVYTLTRFGRNARDTQNHLSFLRDLGVQVRFVADNVGSDVTPTNDFMITVLSGVAQLQSAWTRDASIASKRRLAAQGRWQGGVAPYGLRIERVPDDKGSILVLEEREVEVLRRVWRWIVKDGVTAYGAADRLNTEGFRTRLDREWNHRSLRGILKNDRLVGKKSGQGHLPPIFTRTEFDQLASALAESSQRHRAKTAARPYPLSGRIDCECGGRFIGASRRGHRYYRCNRNETDRGSERCTGKAVRWLRAEPIEAAVWQSVVDALQRPEFLLAAAADHLRSVAAGMPRSRDQEALLDRRVATLERELSHHYRRAAADGVDSGALALAMAEAQRELESARKQQEKVREWKAATDALATGVLSQAELAMSARQMLSSPSTTRKEQIFKVLRIRVTVESREKFKIAGTIPAATNSVGAGTTSPGRD